MTWHRQVADRFEAQQRGPRVDTECHVLRLGDAAFVTNAFELYMDFGLQIKARSRAAQTFVVQLAGPGGYLPTHRALAGKSYGAVPASIVVGPEGGIAPAELERLVAAGAEPVRLGASVLRTSTAGPAAIAVLNATLGRW